MVQFVMTLTVPDNEAAADLAALQRLEPIINGESNSAYVKRVIIETMKDKIREGKAILAKEALSPPTENITIS